ncbi:MAG: FtsX-like permease family protein [Anaerovoracaceae bacterium]
MVKPGCKDKHDPGRSTDIRNKHRKTRKMLTKSTFREIRTSLTRYLAIAAIVALGVGFFSGLKMCKPAMVETARKFVNESRMYDYMLLSTYGIDDESVAIALDSDAVKNAEAGYEVDAITQVNDTAYSIKWMAVPEKLNRLSLKKGRLPENKGECVLDEELMGDEGFSIGDEVRISGDNKKDTRKSFRKKVYTVVGVVDSCLYLDYQRGTTDIGNGSLDGFAYVQKDDLDLECATCLYIDLDLESDSFTDGQKDELKAAEPEMKRLASEITAARRESVMAKAQEKLDEKRADYDEAVAEYNREKADAERKISDGEQQIADGKKEISRNRKKLNSTLASTRARKAELEKNLKQVNEGIAGLEAMGDTESETYKGLLGRRAQLQAGISQCDAGIAKINAGLKTLNSKEKQLRSSEKELKSSKAEADKKFAEAEDELDEAKQKLDEAQDEINELEKGKSYAFSREDNSGYSSFRSNSDIVNNIAKVFPLFFFLVALLVCMTTMTRMIEEQRTQIGVLRALGYSNTSILTKYLFYAASGSVIGAVLGFFAGCKIFPAVIWNAYTMMYSFKDTVPFVFDPVLFALSIGAALLCAVFATWISIESCFKSEPADLIRPKSPPSGRRILLERITPLWNRLSFLYKVSFRNVFRYKKRFFMMLLGISGCTALLIAGFGIDTTVSKVAEHQYTEISLYDSQVMFRDSMTPREQSRFTEYVKKEGQSDAEVLMLHSASADIRAGSESTTATLIAQNSSDFGRFIDLHDGDRPIEYPKAGEAVITKKLQKELGVSAGDEITVKEGYSEMTVKVADFCEYYVGEYIYVTTDTYRTGMGKKPSVKAAYVRLGDDASDEDVRDLTGVLSEHDDVSAAICSIDTLDRVEKMMESLNLVVYVVILCAGLLAFIVIFNLTNINILERIREIATIKVLGFNQREVSQYVFRENMMLTAAASIVGIPLGRWLLDFVIDNIVVSMIYFEPRISGTDYMFSVILTIAFALIVNLAMGRRLDNISMTESLKSIE